MSDAYLMGQGGAVFRKLVVITPPDKTVYYVNTTPDLSGAVIGAQYGRDAVPLHESAWSYSTTPPTVADPNLHVFATIGRRERELLIPVEVRPISPTLNDNDWETIAAVSARGDASQIWHIGDTKDFTLNGQTFQARIIDFNHDPLHSGDEHYADPDYNGGQNVAGITFQFVQAPGQARMHNRNQDCTWATCSMRNTVLSALYNSGLPADMKAVIRLSQVHWVSSGYSRWRTGSYTDGYVGDRLFLPCIPEIGDINPWDYHDTSRPLTRLETDGGSREYAWYAQTARDAETLFGDQRPAWVRSMDYHVGDAVADYAGAFFELIRNQSNPGLYPGVQYDYEAMRPFFGDERYYFPIFTV